MNLATPDRIRSLQRKLYRKAKAEASFTVCPTVKPVGKPDAGNPHVRFDERGRETGRCRTAHATAPFLDSTKRPLKGRGSRPSMPAAGKLNFLEKYKALTEGGVRRLQAQAVGRIMAVRVVPVQI